MRPTAGILHPVLAIAAPMARAGTHQHVCWERCRAATNALNNPTCVATVLFLSLCHAGVWVQGLAPKGWTFTEVKQEARAVFDLFL